MVSKPEKLVILGLRGFKMNPTSFSEKEIRSLLKKNPPTNVKKRLKVLLMSRRGVEYEEIAKKLRINIRTVKLILHRFNGHGLERILTHGIYRGPNFSLVTIEDQKKISELIRKPVFPRIERRLRVLSLLGKNVPVRLIAKKTKMGITNVYLILNAYQQGGLNKIKDPYSGEGGELTKPLSNRKRPKISEERMREIAGWIGDPQSLEYFFTLEDCRKIVPRIQKKWGIVLSPLNFYYRLRNYKRSLN